MAEVELGTVGTSDGYGVHPALLDAAFHALAASSEGDGALWLPFALDRFWRRELVSEIAAAAVSH